MENTRRAVPMVALLLFLIGGCFSIYSGLAISQEKADSIRMGMTRDEVKAAAGPPNYSTEKTYQYRVWNGVVPFSDPLHVDFDADGRVVWISM